jgi:hypothetical protein
MANKHMVGLWFGAVLGGMHLMWAVLVALGWAQSIYDFVLWAHMIHLPLTIGPFDTSAAVTLVIMTAVIGYVMGWVGAWVWHKLHR